MRSLGGGHNVGVSRAVQDLKVIPSKGFPPPYLARVEGWLGLDELQGGVVGDQSAAPSFQIASPGSEGMNDCKELLLMHGVVALCWAELAGLEGNWLISR